MGLTKSLSCPDSAQIYDAPATTPQSSEPQGFHYHARLLHISVVVNSPMKTAMNTGAPDLLRPLYQFAFSPLKVMMPHCYSGNLEWIQLLICEILIQDTKSL